VATDSPLHFALTYRHSHPLVRGTLVVAPLARRRVIGVVVDGDHADEADPASAGAGREERETKPLHAVLDSLPALSTTWLKLMQFAAGYYQRPLGELMAASLPQMLRDGDSALLDKALNHLYPIEYKVTSAHHQPVIELHKGKYQAMAALAGALLQGPLALEAARSIHPQAAKHLNRWFEAGWVEVVPRSSAQPQLLAGPALTAEQQQVLATLAGARGFKPHLLWGATGSGKTEVYLQAAARALAQDPSAQVLVLVPEINLTPQLAAQFTQRFAGCEVVTLHSGLAEGERMRNWLKAHLASASIVLGTRMAVLASLPRLKLILVDEEHDASYKQQEGARYSARDLAVYRAQLEGIPIVLGSATPSLESWHAAQQGKYARLEMKQRIGNAPLPTLRVADARTLPRDTWLAPAVCDAIEERVQRGEQSLIFLNRRGYAPVITCHQCGWLSSCTHCSAYQVFHKSDRTLRCHHCSSTRRVPVRCPDCGSQDLRPVGQGTERLEEWLRERFEGARIARIDADTTRRKGSAAHAFAQVHAGEVDILVGTQMVTKGHDFKRVTLVAALGADSALYSANFRASEMLFAHLMQAAGRAGRSGLQSELWVQTAFAPHPMFAALKKHDYAAYATHLLRERQEAGMPPFSFLALARAEGKTQQDAQGFLNEARSMAEASAGQLGVTLYSPVPMSLQRLADVERAQMLLECANRKALQTFLAQWLAQLRAVKTRVRWAVDVDPLEI
jgi:primosomal protein N' (replication factor Y)